jgi:hypothetical protein
MWRRRRRLSAHRNKVREIIRAILNYAADPRRGRGSRRTQVR